MIERSLSTGGTIVLAAVLGGAMVGFLVNPNLFYALFETVDGWVHSRRASAFLCVIPFFAVGAVAGFGYDFVTDQGVFAPESEPEPKQS